MNHLKKQMITLMLSAKCNLECGYCYVPRLKKIRQEHEKINLDFAYTAIEEYFKKTNNYYIRFFGAGEPTVAFGEMQQIYSFSEGLSRGLKKSPAVKLKSELQTNGIFNNCVRDWIDENIDILWISFDGLYELQNKQRPLKTSGQSSDIVIPNIEYFVKNNKREHFGIRCTVTNNNFHRQIEIVNYLHSLGIKNVCVSPCYSSTANEKVLPPNTIEFAKHFKNAYVRAQELGMSYQTHYIVNFFSNINVEAYCRACVPAPHITTDGHISCCDWALLGEEYLPGVLQKLVYGEYDYDSKTIAYNEEKIKAIMKRTVKGTLGKGSCKGCSVLNNCAGGCVGKTIVVSQDLYTPSREWCSATRYLFKELPRGGNPPSCHHS